MNQSDLNDKIPFLLAEKFAELKQYLSMTKTMHESLDNLGEPRFRKLVSKRQACISKIQHIDRSLEKLLGSGRKKIELLSGGTKGLFEKYINEFRHIMEAAAPMDKQMLMQVANANQDIKDKLLTFKKNRFVANSYRPQKRRIPKYLDVKN